MALYQNVLLAVDLHPEYDEPTISHAVTLAKALAAKLHIINVVEEVHAYGATQGYEVIIDVERKIEEQATEALYEIGMKYNIPESQQIIAKGPPEQVVLAYAQKLNVDLIVVGSHARHGLSLLFGSTADGIVHHAHCDVLAVKAK